MKSAQQGLINKVRGFTLVELLIVITVIGVLAVAIFGAINPIEQVNKSRDTASKADATTFVRAIEAFQASYSCNPWDYTVGTGCAATQTQFNAGSAAPIGSTSIVDMTDIWNVLTHASISELKTEFKKRLASQTTADGAGVNNVLQVSSNGTSPFSARACFRPSSKAFVPQAVFDVTGATGTSHVCVPGL